MKSILRLFGWKTLAPVPAMPVVPAPNPPTQPIIRPECELHTMYINEFQTQITRIGQRFSALVDVPLMKRFNPQGKCMELYSPDGTVFANFRAHGHCGMAHTILVDSAEELPGPLKDVALQVFPVELEIKFGLIEKKD